MMMPGPPRTPALGGGTTPDSLDERGKISPGSGPGHNSGALRHLLRGLAGAVDDRKFGVTPNQLRLPLYKLQGGVRCCLQRAVGSGSGWFCP